MPNIRLMQQKDLNAVNMMLSKAFTQGREDDGYRLINVPMCRPEFLEMYRESCPDGTFISEENNNILACAFSHIWGKVGWIGPIAVTPHSHLQGFGKQITRQCIEFLKQQGCVTIGLETMPRSYRNLGLYSKLGFIPQDLTVDMMRQINSNRAKKPASPHRIMRFSRISLKAQQTFLERARKLVQRIDPNLDYTILIQLTKKYMYGDSLLMIKDSSTVALAIIYTEPTFSEEKQGIFKVIAISAHPKMPDIYLPFLIRDFEQIAHEKKLAHLLIRVPTKCTRVYQFLLKDNFRIIHSDLRMTLKDYPKTEYTKYIHTDRWE